MEIKDHIIIGSGFTGLINAYYAIKRNEKVSIYESNIRSGGLINSIETLYGLVETAANGILYNEILQEVLNDIGLQHIEILKSSKNRYIYYNNKLRKLPLNIFQIIRLFYGIFFKKISFEKKESVSDWVSRILGSHFANNVVQPVLTGIYASDIKQMSAELIFSKYIMEKKRLFQSILSYKTNKKFKKKNIISFHNGMGEMISLLNHFVKKRAKIYYNHKIESYKDLLNQFGDKKITLCVGLDSLLSLMKNDFIYIKKYQADMCTLSLLTVTRFGKDKVLKKEGFGVLFPKNSEVRARGILCNNSIFPNRVYDQKLNSETYIYGGSLDSDILNCSDEHIMQIVEKDRKVLNPSSENPLDYYLTTWKNVLPVYNDSLLKLNQYLDNILPSNLRVEGNFRYGVGLSSILERAYIDHIKQKT